MESWPIIFGVIGALGGLLALADRLIKRGSSDAGLAFEGMTKLASELRSELERKGQEFSNELKEERQECDDRIRRLRTDLQTLEKRLESVEEANGI